MDTYEPCGATTLGPRFRGDDEYHTHRLLYPVEGGISSVEAALRIAALPGRARSLLYRCHAAAHHRGQSTTGSGRSLR